MTPPGSFMRRLRIMDLGCLADCFLHGRGVESITMRPEELRHLLDRRPFVPIRLHFTDGTTYDIRHPEMALLTRSTIEIGLPEDEASKIADRVVYCTLIHIVRVENLDGQRV